MLPTHGAAAAPPGRRRRPRGHALRGVALVAAAFAFVALIGYLAGSAAVAPVATNGHGKAAMEASAAVAASKQQATAAGGAAAQHDAPAARPGGASFSLDRRSLIDRAPLRATSAQSEASSSASRAAAIGSGGRRAAADGVAAAASNAAEALVSDENNVSDADAQQRLAVLPPLPPSPPPRPPVPLPPRPAHLTTPVELLHGDDNIPDAPDVAAELRAYLSAVARDTWVPDEAAAAARQARHAAPELGLGPLDAMDELSSLDERIDFLNALAAETAARVAGAEAAAAAAAARCADEAEAAAAAAVVEARAASANATEAAAADASRDGGGAEGGNATTTQHQLPPLPKPPSAPRPCALPAPLARVAIFTTWAADDAWALRRQLLPWLQYHTAAGVSRFYLAFDGDDPEVLARLARIEHLTVRPLRPSAAAAAADIAAEDAAAGGNATAPTPAPFSTGKKGNFALMAKQGAGAEWALAAAAADGLQWLAHVDPDEALLPDGAAAGDLAAELGGVPAHVPALRFLNFEAMPEAADVANRWEQARAPPRRPRAAPHAAVAASANLSLLFPGAMFSNLPISHHPARRSRCSGRTSTGTRRRRSSSASPSTSRSTCTPTARRRCAWTRPASTWPARTSSPARPHRAGARRRSAPTAASTARCRSPRASCTTRTPRPRMCAPRRAAWAARPRRRPRRRATRRRSRPPAASS